MLHYQNGGLVIDENAATTVPGLYAAGEIAGGVHGRNRMMGNSLLDGSVFGWRAGRAAASGLSPSRSTTSRAISCGLVSSAAMSIVSTVNGFLDLPARPSKPREVGITHVMDKGLTPAQIEGLMATAGDYVDIVKLGWGTSYVTQNLREKLALYRSLGIPVVCGGTLLEIAEVRGKLDGYRSWLSDNGFESVEVSDGTIDLPRERKLEIIEMLAKDFRVLSEVGSKDAEAIFAPYQWVEWIREELGAGAWKVITEARESGTAGIFRGTGEVRSGLIDEIVHELPARAPALRGAPEVAAGLVHPAVRARGQPRQHPARRGHPARNAPARTAVRHDERIAARRLSLIDLHCHSTASDGLLAPTRARRARARARHRDARPHRPRHACGPGEAAGGGRAPRPALRAGHRDLGTAALGLHAPARVPALGRRRAARDAHPGDRRLPRHPQPAHRRAAQRARLSRSSGTTSRGARRAASAGRTSPRRSSTRATWRRLQEAFDRLLADGQPAYVDAGSLGPEEAVELVAASGGAPVLAHPYSLRWATPSSSASWQDSRGRGLRGVECYRPDHDDGQRAFTVRLCAQLGLVPTGGSDWHGRPDGPELGDAGPGAAARGHARATRSCMSTPSC